MQLTNWNPFKEMNQIFDKFNNGNLLSFRNGDEMMFNDWQPSVDVSENDKEYVLKFEVPGIEKKDINIEVSNGMLTVSGEKKYEKSDEKKHRIESFYGHFSRTFTLPENTSEQSIKAEQKNGVLQLHLKKTKEKVDSAKKIEIK